MKIIFFNKKENIIMGCRNSVVEHDGKLFNENLDSSMRLLTGLTFKKGDGGIEGNVQLAVSRLRKREYSLAMLDSVMSEAEVVRPESNSIVEMIDE